MAGLLRDALFSQQREQSEEIMFVYSTAAVQAEMKYRQERIRRDFQRPLWFRKRVPRPPQPCAPELRARPAM
ncbi:hypothetical protein GCM10010530_72200 [Kribbella aluminosa]